jgi:glycerophosphoryl diester phosphodiesterase
VLDGGPLLIAHRGGSALAPENTMPAFRAAVERWDADMIELDVRASADGRCIVLHDATVDRTTNGTGAVASMPYDELRELDAGYRFTPDGGKTYPYRGRSASIPTIEEVLETLPRVRLTVEVKTGAAQGPLFAAIERFGATARVIAAGMYAKDRSLFRGYKGAISASREQLVPFVLFHHVHLARLAPFDADVVQVPERQGSYRLVTPRFIRDLHARGVHVHVWTVNDESDMDRLLDWGVDGLVTDRPDLLGRVLQRRFGRAPTPGHRAEG